MTTTQHRGKALALLSGGLDSILAARLIMEQGLAVQCVHFTSPFFGNAAAVPVWEQMYGLSIEPVDISDAFVNMLQAPPHGFGKVLNPCVDCKITMIRTARRLMEARHAAFVISGEVIGQRPMSQRRDTLNLIRKEAGATDWLLRPLCALHLEPTPMETTGLVNRDALKGFFGRGRKEQMRLAAHFGLADLPSPAGGCRLTERENARRYLPLLRDMKGCADDFRLANVGRQAWHGAHWLCIGRNQADNERLLALARPKDVIMKLADLPGPVALLRHTGGERPDQPLIADTAARVASYSPKAVAAGTAVVSIRCQDTVSSLTIRPGREAGGWTQCAPEEVRGFVRGYNQALDAFMKEKGSREQAGDVSRPVRVS